MGIKGPDLWFEGPDLGSERPGLRLGGIYNKSSKDRTWSAVPNALLNNPVKKWSESRAAAQKGRCPVEHRGKLRDVRPTVCLEGALNG